MQKLVPVRTSKRGNKPSSVLGTDIYIYIYIYICESWCVRILHLVENASRFVSPLRPRTAVYIVVFALITAKRVLSARYCVLRCLVSWSAGLLLLWDTSHILTILLFESCSIRIYNLSACCRRLRTVRTTFLRWSLFQSYWN